MIYHIGLINEFQLITNRLLIFCFYLSNDIPNAMSLLVKQYKIYIITSSRLTDNVMTNMCKSTSEKTEIICNNTI